MRALRAAGLATAAVAAAVTVAHAGPAVTTWPWLRQRYAPRLGGQGAAGGIALTFDDGPDPMATARFLRVLAERQLTATFFLLGTMVRRSPDLARRIADEGHEIALHGDEHRCHLLRGPRAVHEDLARGLDTVREATGATVTWYRPPYGVASSGTLMATRRLGLTPVLWSAWGRDWEARATPDSIVATVLRDLRPGGTVLLHDSDCTSTPGSWRQTLAALPRILDHCEAQQWSVGPLRGHLGPA